MNNKSQLYEERLRKEFSMLQRLQAHPSVKKILQISYMERTLSTQYKPITTPYKDIFAPYKFMVTYNMPMLVGAGEWKRNWSASFTFETPAEILMNPRSQMGVGIVGGRFPAGSIPFNNHISPGWVCTGTAWGIANQGFGIWYFIILLGCLLNQEKFMMAYEDSEENRHLNSSAFRYWKNVRKMKPNNDIRWPFKLEDEIKFGAQKATAGLGAKLFQLFKK